MGEIVLPSEYRMYRFENSTSTGVGLNLGGNLFGFNSNATPQDAERPYAQGFMQTLTRGIANFLTTPLGLVTGNSEENITAEPVPSFENMEVYNVVRWVCFNNKLYQNIELIAFKYPVAGSIQAGSGPDQKPAAASSYTNLIKNLKGVVGKVYRRVLNDLSLHLKIWKEYNSAAYDDDNAFSYLNSVVGPQDVKLIAQMSPESRLQRVIQSATNHYQIVVSNINSLFPIAQILEKYAESALSGGASISSGVMGSIRTNQ